jgi:Uma2 family endonuclease
MSLTVPPPASETERRQAAIEELYRVPENGKAEIIHGRMVRMSPTGAKPGRTAGRIFVSLSQHEERQSQIGEGGGYAFGDNVGFLVRLPDRDSFSPDAAWYTGPMDEDDMDFLSAAPAFAVEVRSKGDYGPKAERAIAEKIRDYFAAGTRVVWDVDTRGVDVVRVHRAESPDAPTIYRRGEVAEAEPAVPGWTMPVDELFPRG